MHERTIRLITFIVLLLTAGDAYSCEQCGRDKALDVNGIAWQQLELRARKFLVRAKTIVEWSVMDSSTAPVDWIVADGLEGVKGEPIDAGEQILRLGYQSKFLGRNVATELWMNPSDAAILQYQSTDSGGRPKHRIYRFTDQGAFQRTWRPMKGEKKMPWQDWSEQYGDFRPFQEAAHNQVVTDSLGLIYIIAASDLGRGGDRLEILAYGSSKVSRGILTAEEYVDIDADFVIEGPSGEQRCDGKVRALRISMQIETVGEEEEPDSGVLSEFEIFMIPEFRMPVLISARAKILGRLVIKAKRARLIDDRVCPGPIQSRVQVSASEIKSS
jgi:hypothetical protein